ncbi:phosphoadenosine phosphosulfate reductase family protein [Sphingomonas aurantiaca]
MHAATRRRAARRNASSRSARRITAGIPSSSAPSCGTSTTRARRRARASASSRSRTGPSLDVWQYIQLEDIPIVPLYFAAPRPTVERDGMLLMVDDDRFRLKPGEVPVERSIRFRTLGCYPLTGAVESEAASLSSVIQEMLLTTTSERQGRAIDRDAGSASMEKKKQEGYF